MSTITGNYGKLLFSQDWCQIKSQAKQSCYATDNTFGEYTQKDLGERIWRCFRAIILNLFCWRTEDKDFNSAFCLKEGIKLLKGKYQILASFLSDETLKDCHTYESVVTRVDSKFSDLLSHLVIDHEEQQVEISNAKQKIQSLEMQIEELKKSIHAGAEDLKLAKEANKEKEQLKSALQTAHVSSEKLKNVLTENTKLAGELVEKQLKIISLETYLLTAQSKMTEATTALEENKKEYSNNIAKLEKFYEDKMQLAEGSYKEQQEQIKQLELNLQDQKTLLSKKQQEVLTLQTELSKNERTGKSEVADKQALNLMTNSPPSTGLSQSTSTVQTHEEEQKEKAERFTILSYDQDSLENQAKFISGYAVLAEKGDVLYLPPSFFSFDSYSKATLKPSYATWFDSYRTMGVEIRHYPLDPLYFMQKTHSDFRTQFIQARKALENRLKGLGTIHSDIESLQLTIKLAIPSGVTDNAIDKLKKQPFTVQGCYELLTQWETLKQLASKYCKEHKEIFNKIAAFEAKIDLLDENNPEKAIKVELPDTMAGWQWIWEKTLEELKKDIPHNQRVFFCAPDEIVRTNILPTAINEICKTDSCQVLHGQLTLPLNWTNGELSKTEFCKLSLIKQTATPKNLEIWSRDLSEEDPLPPKPVNQVEYFYRKKEIDAANIICVGIHFEKNGQALSLDDEELNKFFDIMKENVFVIPNLFTPEQMNTLIEKLKEKNIGPFSLDNQSVKPLNHTVTDYYSYSQALANELFATYDMGIKFCEKFKIELGLGGQVKEDISQAKKIFQNQAADQDQPYRHFFKALLEKISILDKKLTSSCYDLQCHKGKELSDFFNRYSELCKDGKKLILLAPAVSMVSGFPAAKDRKLKYASVLPKWGQINNLDALSLL